MDNLVCDVRRTPAGVSFHIQDGGGKHACLITKDTLDVFAARMAIDTSDADEIDVFRAFETTIAAVAVDLIRKGCDKPCVILTITELAIR